MSGDGAEDLAAEPRAEREPSLEEATQAGGDPLRPAHREGLWIVAAGVERTARTANVAGIADAIARADRTQRAAH